MQWTGSPRCLGRKPDTKTQLGSITNMHIIGRNRLVSYENRSWTNWI